MPKKSWVWSYLTATGNSVLCQFCKKEFNSKNSTSTFAYHFKQIHPDKIPPAPLHTPSKQRLQSESTDHSDTEPPKKKPNLGVRQTTLTPSKKCSLKYTIARLAAVDGLTGDDTLDNLSFLKGIMKMEPQHLLTYN